MPLRNSVTILLALFVSQICYFTASKNRYANVMAEAMSVVEDNSLVQVPKRELFKSAMEGMLHDLDPNSQFLADDHYDRMEEDINQEFAGVGLRIQISTDTGQLTIVRPMPDTPAFRAGLQTGDVILKVNNKSTKDMETDEASSLMRGPVGEPVTLTIQRSLVDPFDVTIIRERIPVPSVYGDTMNSDGTWNFFLESHPHIGYIRLEKFGDRSVDEMLEALQSARNKRGLILDLRSNLGGLLDAAVDISDMFLPEDKLIVATKGREQRVMESYYSTSKRGFPASIPIVILINRRSASASEIVAACLQDHGRVIVIGERSYGKGTVQNLIPIEQGRSFIKLTVASYWRPSNKNIDRTLWDEQEAEEKGEGEWGVQPNQGFKCDMSLEQINLIDIARLMRDTDPERKDLDEPVDQNAAESETNASGNEDSTDANQAPAIPQEIPRWEEIDTPLKKAIEYLERVAKVKAAA